MLQGLAGVTPFEFETNQSCLLLTSLSIPSTEPEKAHSKQ
jgi:hypothetical protein